jgi:hypothetical protein
MAANGSTLAQVEKIAVILVIPDIPQRLVETLGASVGLDGFKRGVRTRSFLQV